MAWLPPLLWHLSTWEESREEERLRGGKIGSLRESSDQNMFLAPKGERERLLQDSMNI